MAGFNSSLCQIAWTEVVHGSQRFAFEQDKPLQLRFGLQFEPSFWSSFESSSYFIEFQVFVRGSLLNAHHQNGNTLELPGASSEELWLGKSFGRAHQVTGRIGLFSFRPQIWFLRSGSGTYIPGEFAVAPEPCFFAIELGGPPDGSGFPFEQFIGGSGLPEP